MYSLVFDFASIITQSFDKETEEVQDKGMEGQTKQGQEGRTKQVSTGQSKRRGLEESGQSKDRKGNENMAIAREGGWAGSDGNVGGVCFEGGEDQG